MTFFSCSFRRLFLMVFLLGASVSLAQSIASSNPLESAYGLWVSTEALDWESSKSINFLGSGKIATEELGKGTFEFLGNNRYQLMFDGNQVKACQVSVTKIGEQEMTIAAVADENARIEEKCNLGKISFKFDNEAVARIMEGGVMGKGAPADLQALSCSALEVGESIRRGQAVVPKTLYHFGTKSSLLKYAKNNGISQSDWDNYIMSGKGRFSLKPFRRGFYGGADTNDISFYSSVVPDDFRYNKAAKITHNWLTNFTLKDECRNPEKVVTFVGLPKNPVFQKWFNATKNKEEFQSVQAVAEVCFIGDEFNPETVESIYSQYELRPCERLLNNFLVEIDAKIVHDSENSRSFYIRDRSCIDSMSALPQEILQMFSEDKTRFLYTTQCPSELNPTSGPTGGDYLLFLILSAINDLRGNVEAQMLDALIQASQEAPADAYNFRNNAPDVLGALKRCQAKKNINEFNVILDGFLAKGYQILSRELAVKFRPLCR